MLVRHVRRASVTAGVLLVGLWLVRLSAGADDKQEVAAAASKWAAIFVDDNPDSILTLYDDEAVLWGTRSSTRLAGKQALRATSRWRSRHCLTGSPQRITGALATACSTFMLPTKSICRKSRRHWTGEGRIQSTQPNPHTSLRLVDLPHRSFADWRSDFVDAEASTGCKSHRFA